MELSANPQRWASPVLAALVVLTACPTSGEAPVCAQGRHPDPEWGGCVPIGCGVGPWGDLPEEGAVHVAAWGSESGDGSRERPLDRIEDAVSISGDAPVLLAAGTWTGPFELAPESALEIRGRCADLVTLDGGDEAVPALTVSGGELLLRDITVTGGQVGLHARSGVEVELRDVVLTRNRRAGLWITSGAVVDVRGVKVHDVVPETSDDGTWAIGVQLGPLGVLESARLEGSELAIRGAAAGMMVLGSGSSVELASSSIGCILPLEVGGSSWALHVRDGGQLIAEGLGVADLDGGGVFVSDPGSRVELVGADLGGGLGTAGTAAVAVQEGAEVRLEDSLIGEQRGVGVWIHGPNTLARLERSEVTGTYATPEEDYGHAVEVLSGGSLEAVDVELHANQEVALMAEGAGTHVQLERAVIRDTLPRLDGLLGSALQVHSGAWLEAVDLTLEGNGPPALLAFGEGTLVQLDDARIRDVRYGERPGGGSGLYLWDEVRVEAEGLDVEGMPGPGAFVATGALLSCTDCQGVRRLSLELIA
jgi:hypothetical protein